MKIGPGSVRSQRVPASMRKAEPRLRATVTAALLGERASSTSTWPSTQNPPSTGPRERRGRIVASMSHVATLDIPGGIRQALGANIGPEHHVPDLKRGTGTRLSASAGRRQGPGSLGFEDHSAGPAAGHEPSVERPLLPRAQGQEGRSTAGIGIGHVVGCEPKKGGGLQADAGPIEEIRRAFQLDPQRVGQRSHDPRVRMRALACLPTPRLVQPRAQSPPARRAVAKIEIRPGVAGRSSAPSRGGGVFESTRRDHGGQRAERAVEGAHLAEGTVSDEVHRILAILNRQRQRVPPRWTHRVETDQPPGPIGLHAPIGRQGSGERQILYQYRAPDRGVGDREPTRGLRTRSVLRPSPRRSWVSQRRCGHALDQLPSNRGEVSVLPAARTTAEPWRTPLATPRSYDVGVPGRLEPRTSYAATRPGRVSSGPRKISSAATRSSPPA